MRTVSVAVTVVAMAAAAGEIRPGLWTGNDAGALPLPSSGYQVYLLGEMHGVKENEAILASWLEKLAGEGLRDVAVEEDAVYEADAQAYVTGRSERLRPELCLRTNVLDVVRRWNRGRPADRMVRVRLVDLDSPGEAIREHLTAVRKRVDARGVTRGEGLPAVVRLRAMTTDAGALRELRTIEHSLRALQQGFEIGIGQSKGSPYLEDREQAIASNIADVAREAGAHGVLAFYGSDHVSKAMRQDGGPKRDGPLAPMALRLERSGLKVFSVVSFPLEGRVRWRGRGQEIFAIGEYGTMSDGERLDRAWERWGSPAFVYVDPTREKMRMPTGDLRSYAVDGFVMMRTGSAMEDRCVPRR